MEYQKLSGTPPYDLLLQFIGSRIKVVSFFNTVVVFEKSHFNVNSAPVLVGHPDCIIKHFLFVELRQFTRKVYQIFMVDSCLILGLSEVLNKFLSYMFDLKPRLHC